MHAVSMKTMLMATAMAAVTLAGASAQTMGGGGRGLVDRSCSSEIARYCADVAHGAGSVPQCLQQHKADLSASCSQALAMKGPGGGRGQGGAAGARWR